MHKEALNLFDAHPWDVTPREAIAIQNRLREAVIREDALPEPVRYVAGVDVGFEAGGTVTRAAIAVLEYPGLALVESRLARLPTRFPYVPGLLSFRELPALLKAWEALDTLPDLILADGQGIAHPRRLGLASHLGVLTGVATIGVGKTRLIGRHGEVPAGRWEWAPLLEGEECVGAVLRTRTGVKPVYVSVGHRIGLESAVAWVMRCTGRFRLPETTRQAHRLASG